MHLLSIQTDAIVYVDATCLRGWVLASAQMRHFICTITFRNVTIPLSYDRPRGKLPCPRLHPHLSILVRPHDNPDVEASYVGALKLVPNNTQHVCTRCIEVP